MTRGPHPLCGSGLARDEAPRRQQRLIAGKPAPATLSEACRQGVSSNESPPFGPRLALQPDTCCGARRNQRRVLLALGLAAAFGAGLALPVLATGFLLRRTSVRARRGDSIATIAARYDLPAATVAGWNKMGARAGLKRGQAVVLYLPVRASAAAARDNAETARSERGESRAARSSARGNARAEQAPKGKAGSTRAAKGRDSADRRAQPAGKKAAPARAQPAASKKPVARTGSAKPAPKAAAKPKANTRR